MNSNNPTICLGGWHEDSAIADWAVLWLSGAKHSWIVRCSSHFWSIKKNK